jgi:hypothetical protein
MRKCREHEPAQNERTILLLARRERTGAKLAPEKIANGADGRIGHASAAVRTKTVCNGEQCYVRCERFGTASVVTALLLRSSQL